MGTVWHAQDTLLRRDVAVKEIELPRTVGADEREAIRKRVLREARAAAALNHANAVTVYDVIEEDGKAFIVMECVAGQTLEEAVRNDGPPSDERLIQIAGDVLSALEVAHRAGIVHRDVKPANVMLTDDGRTKLADFGIASVKDDPKLTASGLILGSPSYMAPEQATHGRSGPEADLWGLGATLYFALETQPPFDGHGPIPTLTAVIGDEPRPMQRQSKLGPVVHALLRKDPHERPSVAQVRDMLNVAGHRTPAAMPGADDSPSTIHLGDVTATKADARARPAPAPPESENDRRPWLWLMGIAAAILVAVLVAMFVAPGDDTNGVAQPEPKQKKEAPAAGSGDSDAGEESADTLVDTGTAEVPEDWATYEDPATGYTLSYPAGWTVERSDPNTYFRAPDGTFLQVGWRSPPDEAGPVGAWEEYEPSFAARQENYDRITIEETDFKGMEAAWWEMTYGDRHAVNLGFITPDGDYGMALFFNTAQDDWESSQTLFEQLRASFQPPA